MIILLAIGTVIVVTIVLAPIALLRAAMIENDIIDTEQN